MLAPISRATRTVGIRAGIAATACAVAYVLAQLAEWFGWLGSAGGPDSPSTPFGLAVLLTPSLLLGPSFLVLMVSVHQLAAPSRRVWSHAAVAFATVYAVMISINYYVQLAWVAPRIAAGRTAGIEVFLFTPFDSFLYAVDILGYSFMSLSMLFAAPVFEPRGPDRLARGFLIATGVLIPFLLFQMFWHPLIWFASAWAITFPAATGALVGVFRRQAVATAEG